MGLPYTRKEYMGGVPQPKITKFSMGNPSGSFNAKLELVAKEEGQIRHNALEASRMMAGKYLESNLGAQNFYMVIRPYPHIVLRENKMMAFAGADRLQDGMRLSFGDPVGTAARVKAGDTIISINIRSDKVEVGKEALRRAAAKLPIPTRIEVKVL